MLSVVQVGYCGSVTGSGDGTLPPIIIPSNTVSGYLTVVAAGGGGVGGSIRGMGGSAGQMLFQYPLVANDIVTISLGSPGNGGTSF